MKKKIVFCVMIGMLSAALSFVAAGCGNSAESEVPTAQAETDSTSDVPSGVDETQKKMNGEEAAQTGISAAEVSSGGAYTGEAEAQAGTTGEEVSFDRTSGVEAAQAGTTGAESASTDISGAQETAAQDSTARDSAAEYRGLVVIDPGHQQYANLEQEPIGPGASETKNKVSGGTSGVASGVPEYQLNLEISLQLRDELEERGYQVIMVRETNDVDISNSERAEVANEADADVFIRIHANGIGDSGHTGAMTICQTPGNVFNGDLYEASRALADSVLNAYTEKTGIDYEYVWETDTMSGINWCRVPVTILEMGYMSNREEDLEMQDPEMQKLMTEGIADGIDDYMADVLPKEREWEDK